MVVIDKHAPVLLIGAMLRRFAAFATSLIFALPAAAMVGGAPAVDASDFRSEVMILSGRGNLCTGILLAQDLVLTAAHCIEPGLTYKLYELDAERKPVFHDLAKTVVHPQFSKASFEANRATADLALLKLAAPLPAKFIPAVLAAPRARVAVGESFYVIGYGVTAPRDNRSAAVLRRADLIATGKPGNLQLRLFDPATKGESPGLGACTGDSGGPVYEERTGTRVVYGLVSWTTGPKASDGCGGLTGVTPLELYQRWIADTARKLGNPLTP
jgi:secreted trypsin-like serine protease